MSKQRCESLNETHLNFGSDDFLDSVTYLEVSKYPFNYYVRFLDGSSFYQSFDSGTATTVENDILTLSGYSGDEIVRVHMPLQHVRSWAELGAGKKSQ